MKEIELFFFECLIYQGSAARYGNRWVELVIIEAKDLIAADIGGTSDPFVRVQYGNTKKQTKVGCCVKESQ
jgi:C2 domain